MKRQRQYGAVLAALIWAALSAWGAEDPVRASGIGGPVLGYVYDAAVKGVRPILGVPGAATMGEPLEAGFEMVQAAVSPEQDYILAVAAEGREVRLLKIKRGVIAGSAMPDLPPDPEQIVLSPMGSAAAFRYPGADRIQVVAGFPDAPILKREIDLSTIRSSVTAVAISDDADTLLVASEDGTLFVTDSDGGVRAMGTFGHVAALKFLERGHDALVADATGNSIYLIRDAAGAGPVVRMAGERDGVAGPREVVASRDGRRAVVMNGGAGDLILLDLVGGPAVRVACEVTATGLERLDGNAVFRLTEAGAGPVWLLDGDWPEPRVIFVAATGGQR